MDVSAWMALESAMQGDQPRRGVSRSTLRRIGEFARPHRRALVLFLILSVISAILTVATPVLAGRVVDAIVGRQELSTIVGLAVLIAAIAVVEAGTGLAERWQSARIGE